MMSVKPKGEATTTGKMDSCKWINANLWKYSSEVQLGGYLEPTQKIIGGIYVSLGLGMAQYLLSRARIYIYIYLIGYLSYFSSTEIQIQETSRKYMNGKL